MGTRTVLRTKAQVSVTCENCEGQFAFERIVGVPSSIFYDMSEKLVETVAGLKFGTHACPHCGYLQSWMWDQAFDEGVQGAVGAFTMLPLWGLFSHRWGMSWWLGLLLAILSGTAIIGVIQFLVNRHVHRKHISRLAARGYVVTAESLIDLEKRIGRPGRGPAGMVGLDPGELAPLLNVSFESEAPFVRAIAGLENGRKLLLFKKWILRASMRTRAPSVRLEKPD